MVIHGVIIPEKGIVIDLSMAKGHNCEIYAQVLAMSMVDALL